ncbi:carboxypeptidase-like regulatory domain-containing protein [Allomuricauda sp. d1]|uniref:carboxypeptidase-like regulatory domain-containing protein n=1 Tax=Allomuricauda sp. d1 TaxID=3136725 RepID=UPI0031CEAC71
MRIFIIMLSVLCTFSSLIAQENPERISLSFENEALEKVLLDIEEKTNYRFYYSRQWLSDIKVSGIFSDADVTEILDAVLNKTVLNFYVLGSKIILTQNNLIYDELPDGFFGVGKDTVEHEEQEITNIPQAPILVNEKVKTQKRVETYRIGKETDYDNKSKYALSGYVKNAKTNNPIPDLSILLKDAKTGVVTDDEGYYSILLPPGLNLLETRSLGIENIFIRVIIYNDGALNLTLNEEVEQLDEVVLSADIYENVEETDTGVEEIDIEESKNIPLVLGERDVLRVATNLPGISTAGEGSAGFNVRGGKSDQNLILFDDAVLYSPQHFFGIFSALNPFVLGSATIYKGSIPIEYGGRLSSVFDLTTKEVEKEKFSGEGSVGPVTANLAVEVPVINEKASVMLAGRGAYSNWILRSLNDESLNDSEASFYDATIVYEHKINENNQVKATGYLSRDDFSITSDSLYVYDNKLLSLNWNHQFKTKTSLDLNFAYSQYGFGIEFDGDANNDFELGYKVQETGFRAKFKSLVSPSVSLDYGISSKLYGIRPGDLEPKGGESSVERLSIPKEQALESSAFISSTIDINDKLSIDIGGRLNIFNALGPSTQFVYDENAPRGEETVVDTLQFDDNEVIKTYIGPELRVSGRYLLSESLSVKASLNNSYQYIHRLSNNTTVSPIDTWKLSDLNIEPQMAYQASLGLYKNINSNKYEISLEGFYKTSDNILDFKTGSQILLNENIEREVLQGDGKAYGVEFLIRKNQGKLNGWLGYTYSRSFIKLDSEFDEERVNNGEFFPSNFDKPHDISLIANYKFTRRFSLSTNFVYQTGRPVTFPIGNFNFGGSNFVAFSDRNQFRIPDFYRLDLGFNIEGNHKKNKLAHSFWTISVYNVLGRNNPYSVFFVTEQGEIKALQSSIFAIPVPSITYNFKF